MKSITLLAALAPLPLAACATLFGTASPFAFDKKGELVEFNYAWSAETSRDPALVRLLRRDLESSFKATAQAAEADRAQAKAADRPFTGHRYSRRWTTAGQSARLLSLDGRLTTSTGGGSIYGVDGLLWDRTARSKIAPGNLFRDSGDFTRLVRLPGCAALARRPSGPDACAGYDLAIVPTDANRNRRFDHFLVANAGAAANGGQVVDVRLPVTAALLAALKPAYRAGFEVAQPQ